MYDVVHLPLYLGRKTLHRHCIPRRVPLGLPANVRHTVLRPDGSRRCKGYHDSIIPLENIPQPLHHCYGTGARSSCIVANTFWDPQRQELYKMSNLKTRNDASYYGGEPIWITAQKQGIKTGNIYWVGSDIAVKGQHPTYYHVYDQKPRLTQTERVAEALRMLKLPEEERPQLVMIYFEDSDTYGHTYSPHSKETRRCVEELDALMKYLWEGLQSLPFGKDINLIVTSDHGMATVSADRFVPIKHLLNENGIL